MSAAVSSVIHRHPDALRTSSARCGCCWWMRQRRSGEAAAGAETTGHVWDGDLTRIQQSAAALVAVAVLHHRRVRGRLPGAVSGPRQLRRARSAGPRPTSTTAQQRASARRRRSSCWRRFAGQPHRASCARDPDALRVGRNLFANNCAICHGSDARGAPGFPNLTDSDWLWGGAPEQRRGHDRRRPHRRHAIAWQRRARRRAASRTWSPTCCRCPGARCRPATSRAGAAAVRRQSASPATARTARATSCWARRISPTTSGCTAARADAIRDDHREGPPGPDAGAAERAGRGRASGCWRPTCCR